MCSEDTHSQNLATVTGLGSITLCPCGTVTLHIGGVSIRLEPSAFAQTTEMCRLATDALKIQAQALQAAAAATASRMTH